jgi:hypothetical protein
VDPGKPWPRPLGPLVLLACIGIRASICLIIRNAQDERVDRLTPRANLAAYTLSTLRPCKCGSWRDRAPNEVEGGGGSGSKGGGWIAAPRGVEVTNKDVEVDNQKTRASEIQRDQILMKSSPPPPFRLHFALTLSRALLSELAF